MNDEYQVPLQIKDHRIGVCTTRQPDIVTHDNGLEQATQIPTMQTAPQFVHTRVPRLIIALQ